MLTWRERELLRRIEALPDNTPISEIEEEIDAFLRWCGCISPDELAARIDDLFDRVTWVAEVNAIVADAWGEHGAASGQKRGGD